jgi:hypothetical protein
VLTSLTSIGVRYTTLFDKVCQGFATGGWFSPGPPFPSNNKTDRHNISEILLKLALIPITITHIVMDIVAAVLLVKETGVPGENHHPATSH